MPTGNTVQHFTKGAAHTWKINGKIYTDAGRASETLAAMGVSMSPDQLKALSTGKAWPMSNVRASLPSRTRPYDFSFGSDLDRELFITEIEAATGRMKLPQRPKLETWNASATVWTENPAVVAAVRKIALGYTGVKMSNVPVSAAGTMIKDPAGAAAAEQKAMAYLQAAKAAGENQDWKRQASNFAAHQQQLITREMCLGKISREDAMRAIQSIHMSNVPVSAGSAPTKRLSQPRGSLDLSLPSDSHAQQFAAAALKLGGKVTCEGNRVKCDYDYKNGNALMSLAAQAHGSPVSGGEGTYNFKFADLTSLGQFLTACRAQGLRVVSKGNTAGTVAGDLGKLTELASKFQGVRASLRPAQR